MPRRVSVTLLCWEAAVIVVLPTMPYLHELYQSRDLRAESPSHFYPLIRVHAACAGHGSIPTRLWCRERTKSSQLAPEIRIQLQMDSFSFRFRPCLSESPRPMVDMYGDAP
jgi:hypothetical protein